MTPVRVVEITPERLPVVEITPVFVVEITPALVVEMTPVFANVLEDSAVTNNIAPIADLRFFIVLLLVIRNQGVVRSALEFAAKPFFKGRPFTDSHLAFTNDVPKQKRNSNFRFKA
jgi:hypothetical protein